MKVPLPQARGNPYNPPAVTDPVTHVSDTARWVAFYRAMESEREDALFRDPFARRLAGDQGERIVRTIPKGERFAWPMIVRTAVLDELVTEEVVERGADVVVNLASGLDARPWRMHLPSALRWYDVDFPAILAYKKSHLEGAATTCFHDYVEADLTDADARREAFRRTTEGARRALAITEGLLIYLEPEQVGALAKDLRARPEVAAWITDLGSPRVKKMMEKNWGRQMERGNATFKFAPAEGTAFFEPFGWREAEYRSIWTESLRLGRSVPLARLWNAISHLYPKRKREEFARMSRLVRLVPGE